ncbi:MAG: SDR family oxidoreductase [Spirochaetaceae bacterium]|nr:MAG: SDR family oxidoreductase [Spirochaetaceae bacterium]
MGDTKYDFTGKTAIITGATKGIGRDIASSFARAGCALGITGRSEKDLRELADEARGTGVRCETYKADLSIAEECIAMAEHFVSLFPVIDILVNDAGLSFPEKLIDLDVAHWDTTLAVNLRAPALISKVIAKKMIARGHGAIINVSSNASLAGIEEHAAYCASKFGLDGLTKVMAVELGPCGIRVNAIAPTVVLTPMGAQVWGDPKKADPVKAKIPLGRFAQPSEVTAAAFFLASEGAGMIHGETLVIDGGVNAKLY